MHYLLQNLSTAFRISKDPKTIDIHPKLGKGIKWQFEAGGKHYYELLHTYEMPITRFRFAKIFYQEMENKVTHPELRKVCELLKEYLNGGKEGVVKIGEAYKVIDDLEYQLDWAFEPTSLLRLASVIYFTLDEPLDDYDSKYNEPKINSFKKKEVLAFLLKKLMTGSKILSDLSAKDLDTYLTEMLEQKEQMSFTEGGKRGRNNRSMKTTLTTSTLETAKK